MKDVKNIRVTDGYFANEKKSQYPYGEMVR